ncbi:hypothetical protein F5884DRAFT_687764 [Xylogone sp. PMI_703]|nr:hypothetical protein F5884DRAFT_687764 [Xylogone sp. PMI_703]
MEERTAISQPLVQLELMPQLREARYREDDWTGLTDAAARRKRQNRLHQRAHRKRQKARESNIGHFFNSNKDGSTRSTYAEYQSISASSVSRLHSTIKTCNSSSNTKHLYHAADALYFPLSMDHLIVVVQLNVLRAVVTNISLVHPHLSVPTQCDTIIPVEPFALPSALAIPFTLQPTVLQSTTPHPFWIDLIPLGKWRDNMILASGTFDEDELCVDIVGGLWEGFSDADRRGLVVWNTPWDIRGWEVSEGFWEKWGWLLKGCNEALTATNYWRSVRNEEPLVVEI